MKTYTFNKDVNNKWHIDLPSWKGSMQGLEIVAGADDLLTIMANKKNKLSLTLDTKEFKNAFELSLQKTESKGGAWYFVKSIGIQDVNKEIWLSDITQFIFGNYPQHIFVTAKL